MGLLVLVEFFITVAGGRIGDRVEAGRIESDHTYHCQDQDERSARHRVHDVEDQPVEVAALLVLRDEVRCAGDLKSQAVVAEDDKADDRRSHAENISSEHRLPDGPSAADVADEERRRDAPYHPVRPVVDRPILGEVVGARRIRVGAQLNEVLEHLAQTLESVLYDESSLSSDQQYDDQQAKKQINAKFCQKTDALKPMQHRVSVHRAGDEQDDDRHCSAADTEMEKLNHDARHKGRRHRECRRCTGQKSEKRKQINDSPEQSVGVLVADHRPARFTVSLSGALAHVQHEAERNREHQIKSPGDKTPVEQRENACPLGNGAHLRDVRVRGVHNPLRKGIEQNIRRQTAGEHHGAPCEEVVLRLLAGLSQHNVPVFGHREENRDNQDSQSDYQIIETHRVSKEESHLRDDHVRLLRVNKQIYCQPHNENKGNKCDHPVDPAVVCCSLIVAHG